MVGGVGVEDGAVGGEGAEGHGLGEEGCTAVCGAVDDCRIPACKGGDAEDFAPVAETGSVGTGAVVFVM